MCYCLLILYFYYDISLSYDDTSYNDGLIWDDKTTLWYDNTSMCYDNTSMYYDNIHYDIIIPQCVMIILHYDMIILQCIITILHHVKMIIFPNSILFLYI